MRKQATARKGWTKPVLKRLGKLKEVSGAQGAGAQFTVKT